ncbi:DUF6864 domain-containing function [Brucella intermedia]|uniref:DUF6864 domain-containing function n=1 Tax=Brucella intermedia TaxID=94625 RepID=UPI00165D15F8|nr:hypothetical protein [Brucella intermedia]QNQ39395.1 hypothetical protein IAR37_08390 [Brucella intermedia]
MSANEPFLNFTQAPPIKISLGAADVLHSGSIVVPVGEKATIEIANLRYVIVFESNGGENNVEARDSDDRGFSLVLHNFDNPLGTSLRPIQIGTVQGKPLWISLFVQAPAGEKGPHVMSFTLYWGGQFG